MTPDQPEPRGPALTPVAAVRAKEFIDDAGVDGLALRVAVMSAGCAGPRYQLGLDERTVAGDVREHWHGVDVVVDAASAPYLEGATIDWVDRDGEQGFIIDAPAALGVGCAESGCAAGCC